MLSDSTVKLDPPAADALRPLDPLTPGGKSGLLRTYHDHLGNPILGHAPPERLEELCWNARYQVQKLLGQGAQGVVYLAKREGVDGYFTSVALKLFHRHPTFTREEYQLEMRRVARQAKRVSGIQHDNLINIRDFVALGETRIMVLEWIDGLDLDRLLELKRFAKLQKTLSKDSWHHLNDVIVTPGQDHGRLKPGIAVDILRGCLAGLSSLHHHGIVHCDLKPSNIMIKRTGTKKIIDLDSSCIPAEEPSNRRGTPYYMSPEQHLEKPVQVQSDIASLGYILIEMLTGRLLFRDCQNRSQLLEAKLKLPSRLGQLLPPEVQADPYLRGLVSKMVAVEPKDRFRNADAAELDRMGTVSFQRNLVKTNLSTEYDRELAWWLDCLGEASHDATALEHP
jgi:serine/threonine-protein kinase